MPGVLFTILHRILQWFLRLVSYIKNWDQEVVILGSFFQLSPGPVCLWFDVGSGDYWKCLRFKIVIIVCVSPYQQEEMEMCQQWRYACVEIDNDVEWPDVEPRLQQKRQRHESTSLWKGNFTSSHPTYIWQAARYRRDDVLSKAQVPFPQLLLSESCDVAEYSCLIRTINSRNLIFIFKSIY